MLTGIAFSQQLDSAFIRIQYASKAKNYIDREKLSEDLMFLDAGNKGSKFYSFYNFYSDSLKQSLEYLGLSAAEIFEKTRKLQRGSSDQIYKDYSNSSINFVSKILNQDYWYADNCVQQWDLTQDTLTILNYICHKAVCDFRGREWIVWYTPEIPMKDGPWKLGGLPGLILKAEDSKGEFSFECKGMTIMTSKFPLTLPYKEKGNNYIKTEGKAFMQVKRKSIEDLKGSIAAQGMSIHSITNESGQKEVQIPKMLMNAIEVFD
jgi:GLPGLI family protein